jgi:tripartite-type tricarboxylate transporter receptor subunit TctC
VDIAGRTIAAWLTEQFGQPVTVDNQPGESGNRATRYVIKADPDGYTLLVCGPVNTINTTLFEKLDFDFARDASPIASLWRVPLVIEVQPALGIRTLEQFIAYAKANPGKLKIGFAGNGTPQHIGIELFKTMARVDLTLVPYLGSTPALADLLAGKIDGMFDPLPSSIAHVNAGKLVPLAITTPTRSVTLPDVPVAGDVVPGYEAGSWFGLVAPKNLPAEIAQRINDEVNRGLGHTKISERLKELGGTALPGSRADFAAFISSETEKYRKTIKAANIKRV